MNKRIHIVSFDVPFPADYGGVIDVFYKIRALKNAGVNVILHCFEYGERTAQAELEKYCEKVFYYKRVIGIQGVSLLRPYIVNSRKNPSLLKNLRMDESPILFEGMHTCYFLNHPQLANRSKYVRTHNIEHEYYHSLAQVETNKWKRFYYNWEAKYLKRYEAIYSFATGIFSISKSDNEYFSKKFISYLLPAFHEHEIVTSKIGQGTYGLYHGNLAVAENERAALFLLDQVFSKTDFQFKIVGANPSESLKSTIAFYDNVTLIENPNQAAMADLISAAQCHILYSEQASGLKLKLLNSLFQGRFVIANNNMLIDQPLKEVARVANTATEYIHAINLAMGMSFSPEMIIQRQALLDNHYSNKNNIDWLINKVFA